LNTRGKERKYKISPHIKIVKKISSGTYLFREIFKGFEDLLAVKNIFGGNTLRELDKLTVEVFPKDGFMGVSDEDGHIFASQSYLNDGDEWCVYLDVIHELVHVRQFKEGKNLFDPQFVYVDRATEIEAYSVGVEEARRIGLSEMEIFDYLKVPWISDKEHQRLARSAGLKIVPEK
jgi:hypothetical protein